MLPADPQALLDDLNTYRTRGTDTAGYCNAVGVSANMQRGRQAGPSWRSAGTTSAANRPSEDRASA